VAGSVPPVLVHSRRCSRTPPRPHGSINANENEDNDREDRDEKMSDHEQYAPGPFKPFAAPTAPMYLVRKPSRAQATMALAHLASGANHFLRERDIAGVRREMGHDQQRVGGVEPDTYHIEIWHSRHCSGYHGLANRGSRSSSSSVRLRRNASRSARFCEVSTSGFMRGSRLGFP
jgi:hypothetical protein